MFALNIKKTNFYNNFQNYIFHNNENFMCAEARNESARKGESNSQFTITPRILVNKFVNELLSKLYKKLRIENKYFR